MYTLDVDERQHRVIVEFHGFLTPDSLAGLDEALQAAALRAKAGAAHFDMLCDFSQCEVMDQSTSKDSERRIAWCLANGLRKSANLVSRSLMSVQIRRVAPDPRFQMFTERAEAEAWLDQPLGTA